MEHLHSHVVLIAQDQTNELQNSYEDDIGCEITCKATDIYLTFYSETTNLHIDLSRINKNKKA